jgi:murein DD-endopeptidase MepM/ murein hydrolase activator NlpD
MQIIKWGGSVVCVLLLAALCIFINYAHAIAVAKANENELKTLRSTNAAQSAKIQEIAQDAASLQANMQRLNHLDREVRSLSNIKSAESSAQTSRAGIDRSAYYSGQGGPTVQPNVDELINLFADLKTEAIVREKSLQDLKDQLEKRAAEAAQELKIEKYKTDHIPSIWPVHGTITSGFGYRASPWGAGRDWHPGVDIASNYGTPVVATADGIVEESDYCGGYGYLVKINHGNGIETLYGHNSQLLVHAGERVKRGQVIARMGSTGASTGPHCHYEIRVGGNAVNPMKYLN